MKSRGRRWTCALAAIIAAQFLPQASANAADAAGLTRVAHIIVLMQENHSFDNYLGALPYVPNGHYHPPRHPGGPCDSNDHLCVDGLTCARNAGGNLSCTNSNPSPNGGIVHVFHETRYCTSNPPHEWFDAHREANFDDPNSSIVLADGFAHLRPDDPTSMGFYTERELPFFYALARTFALSDTHFSALIGPTMPNRSYLMAATSFGHVMTSGVDDAPPVITGYKLITGTIFDLLDRHRVTWAEYYQPGNHMTPPRPYGRMFRAPWLSNFKPLRDFFTDAAAGRLPAVAFVSLAQHEHPPLDIRAGQYDVARVTAALRVSPEWGVSVMFLTYDENGGYYDHAIPPAAPPPDAIPPGACADRNNPPRSLIPGHGSGCIQSARAQARLCAMARLGQSCVGFTSFGFRDPLIAISPFAKSHYVSHVANDQTSILAFIEKRFLGNDHLTARDASAKPLEDMFDFDGAPSRDAPIDAALAPSPRPNDPGCPFKEAPH
jgi:phospholipase C